MRLNLGHRILLLLVIPVLIASAIVFIEFQNLRTIHKKITVLQFIDDINVTILELRRYEKNILLFSEERNIRLFHEHFDNLKNSIQKMEREIVSDLSKIQYRSLRENIDQYDDHVSELISTTREEHRIINEIRPLGRAIENGTSDKQTALDLRRYEKNFIIYKEQAAVYNVHSIAKTLVKSQPVLAGTVERYLGSFDLLVENEQVKDNAGNRIRHYGREIQKTASDLSAKKRADIGRILSRAKFSFLGSFVFLLATTAYGGYIISTRILRTVKNVGRAVQNMAKGDFTYILDPAAPKEIAAFNKAFNCTVRRLEEARVELELTLAKLEDTNHELLERQEELVEARKMTAMRLLASEIAHEVSNPMSSLITHLGMLREEMRADNPKKEDLTFMLSEATRCHAILRELVDFARKEPLQLKEVDPSKLIREAVENAGKLHKGKSVRLSASLEELPDCSVLDPVLMYQAFFNILMNAYQHTSDGDTIDIDGRTDGTLMKISVRDTGKGISEDILPYVFDPFFSTRKDDGGNGLGLAITKKIVERHRGSIQVSSDLGKETVFQITLPVQADRP